MRLGSPSRRDGRVPTRTAANFRHHPVKSIRHLVSEPEALFFLPFITVVMVLVMVPIKAYALLTQNRQGWITRRRDQLVAEGQEARTLEPSM